MTSKNECYTLYIIGLLSGILTLQKLQIFQIFAKIDISDVTTLVETGTNLTANTLRINTGCLFNTGSDKLQK